VTSDLNDAAAAAAGATQTSTPLLDIKPYVARFDSVPDANEGWFTGVPERPKPPGRE